MASQSQARKAREMTLTFTHIATVVAGFLAVVAIGGLTNSPRIGLIKNAVVAVAVAVAAALLITAARNLG
jgi:hypothetical protein